MTAKMTTLIEQFGGVNGVWRSSPHNQTAVREPQKVKPGKGNLFVLVEAQGQTPKVAEVEKRLAALVRDAYYLASGGVTASLRRAVQAANLWLFQQNSAASDDQHLLLAGLIAVVIRDDDLFLAQVGPTALFSVMSRFVRRYPETSFWLDQPQADGEEEAASALGMYHYVDPLITHLQIEPGDVVVLTDARLARQLSLPAISQAIQGKNVSTFSQNLTRIVPQPYGSAIVIQLIAANVVERPIDRTLEKIPAEAGAGGKGFNFSIPNLLHRSDRPTSSHAAQPQDDREIAFGDDAGDSTWAEHGEDRTGSGSTQIARVFRNMAVAIVGSVAFLGGGLHTILKLVLPGSQAEPKAPQKAGAKAHPAPARQPSYRALKYVAIGLPIVILIATLLTVWYRGYSRENAYAAMVSDAQQKFAAAQAASPETAVSLLAQAESQLNQAAAIKEGQSEIETLQTDIIARRDELGRVERLYYIPELRRYTDPGTQLRRVIVRGIDVYVLDTGLDRVFHHTLDDVGESLLPDEGNPVLLQRGQTLADAVVDDIIDMVWMPAAGGRQTSDLLILSRDGLLEYNTDWGTSPTPISGSEFWQSPVAVSSYFGNFYLLDTQANFLHRYWPTFEGYENPPESYFVDPNAIDLSDAVDMAIDGSIYILYQHGEIKKFLGGEPALFQITGLDMPLNNPTAIYTAPDEQAQYLYVADAGNQRVVQFTKDGQFIRQFKPRLEDEAVFNDLKSIYVDEISEKMFVLNGSSLYAPNVPFK
jgi:hypothetical protein